MVSCESFVYEGCCQRDVVRRTKGDSNFPSVQMGHMYDPTYILPLEEGEDMLVDEQRRP